MQATAETSENESLELRLLLDAIFLKYGYDFRDYAKASLKRRVRHRLQTANLHNISEMQHRILNDREIFEELLLDLSINVTEMFRNPRFFKALREHVLPQLAARRFVKIWHAGCATGEEVYSMAILLHEEGLLDRCRIFATDLNQVVLAKAREGIYPAEMIRKFTSNYQAAGGIGSFADYYTARYDSAILDASLRTNIVFADHNLATDGVFGEMDLIVCRNVLIYFNRQLQDRVLRLFSESLAPGGILCIGSKESVRFSGSEKDFETQVKGERIYRKTASADTGGAL